MEWRVFWPAQDAIHLQDEFASIYTKMKQGKVSKAGRTDIYLQAPPFVGIKLRGANLDLKNNDHKKHVWELKMRTSNDSVNGVVGIEGWEKSYHNWTKLPTACQEVHAQESEEMKQIRASLTSNVEIAVQKKRVSFGSKKMAVGNELTALTVTQITVDGKPIDLEAKVREGRIQAQWFTICIERNSHRKKYLEDLASRAQAVIGGSNQANVSFVYGGYPTWIHSFDVV